MKKDWILFTDVVLIVAIGLTTLYSTVIGSENILTGGGVVNRQLIFVLVGFLLYFVITRFDYRFTGHPQVIIPLYVVIVLLLIGLLLFGTEINNAKRWILLGSFRLQPSEFAKIILILATSWLFSLRTRFNVWILAAVSFVTTIIVSILVFLEPDAGTAILIFATWAIIAFTILPDQMRNFLLLLIGLLTAAILNIVITGNYIVAAALCAVLLVVVIIALYRIEKLKYLVVLALIAGLLAGAVGRYAWYNILEDYQQQRVEAFINPEAVDADKRFQVDQSKVAVGSGQLIGKGFGHGTQSKLKFLPEHQTDFVFAAFAEEFGLLGVLFLMLLYAVLIFRIIQHSTQAGNVYGMLICVGVAAIILLEVFVNIGMNLGITPATGVPLPFMSSGGSIFLTTMIGLGLVQSVVVHKNPVDQVDSV